MKKVEGKNTDIKIILLLILKYVIIALVIVALCFLGFNSRRIIQYVQIEVARYEASQNKPYNSIATYLYSLKMYKDNPQAYIELYQMYKKVEDDYSAKVTLEAGYERTQSEEIYALLKEINDKESSDQKAVAAQNTENDNAADADQVKRMTIIDSKGNKEISDYEYNENKDLITVTKTDGEGVFTGREEYLYDEDNEPAGTENYKLRYTKRYSYDENGNLANILEDSVYESGTDTSFHFSDDFDVYTQEDFDYAIVYTYNEDNQITEIVAQNATGTFYLTNKYDKKTKNRTGTVVKSDDQTVLTDEAKYDSKGNLTKEVITFDSNDPKERKTINYTYTEDNLPDTINTQYEYYDNETRRWETNTLLYYDVVFNDENVIYVYDDNGRLKAEMNYVDNTFISSYKYVYDNKGNLSEETFYEPRSLDDSIIIDFEYDDKNNVSQVNGENLMGEKTRIEVFEYDSKGNCESHLFRNNSEDSESKDSYYTYLYDDNNRLIEENVYYIVMSTREDEKTENEDHSYSVWYKEKDSLGNVTLEGYEEYDIDGNLMAETFFDTDEGRLTQRIEYKYDKNGYLIEKDVIGDKGVTKEKVEYEYNYAYQLYKEIEHIMITSTREDVYQTEYFYYDDGRLDKKKRTDLTNDNSNAFVWKYSYDNDKRMTQCDYQKIDEKEKVTTLETTEYEY